MSWPTYPAEMIMPTSAGVSFHSETSCGIAKAIASTV